MHRQILYASSLTVFLAIVIPAYAGTLGFKPAVSYPVGSAPTGVAVGDFNGDGNPDLVIANSGNVASGDGANVSVLLGNGDGTFQDHVEYAGRGLPISILVADFNGDSRSDLAVASQCSGCSSGISVLLGNGDGTFQPRIDQEVASPQTMAVADFDLDGKPDLAVAAPLASIDILLGNGDGTFRIAAHLDGDNIVRQVQIGDFNDDGKPDLAVISTRFQICLSPPCPLNQKPEAKVILNNGDGTFSVLGVATAETLTLADFDGDRNLDLAIASSSANAFSVFLGKKDGFDVPLSFTGFNGAFAISADVNRDKAPDLIGFDTAANTIAVLLNTGTDFSLSVSNPTPSTITRGKGSSSNVAVTLLNGFDSRIALTCSVQPAEPGAPSCSVTPDSVTPPPNGTETAMLSISPGESVAAVENGSLEGAWFLSPLFVLVGVRAIFKNGSNKKKLAFVSAMGVLYAAILFQVACGGGSDQPHFKSYAVTVTGSSATNEHSSTVSLTFQR